jgi:hypothetical protein
MSPIKIERVKRYAGPKGWVLRAHYPNGFVTWFGCCMSEVGSKRMLTVRARQFNLTVNDARAYAD